MLTAAHCISLSATPSTYTVRLGEHDKSVQEGTEVELSLERVSRLLHELLSCEIDLLQVYKKKKDITFLEV